MYFTEPSLLLHQVMPVSLQFSQAQGQTHTLIYQRKATRGGQTQVNYGPPSPKHPTRGPANGAARLSRKFHHSPISLCIYNKEPDRNL